MAEIEASLGYRHTLSVCACAGVYLYNLDQVGFAGKFLHISDMTLCNCKYTENLHNSSLHSSI